MAGPLRRSGGADRRLTPDGRLNRFATAPRDQMVRQVFDGHHFVLLAPVGAKARPDCGRRPTAINIQAPDAWATRRMARPSSGDHAVSRISWRPNQGPALGGAGAGLVLAIGTPSIQDIARRMLADAASRVNWPSSCAMRRQGIARNCASGAHLAGNLHQRQPVLHAHGAFGLSPFHGGAGWSAFPSGHERRHAPSPACLWVMTSRAAPVLRCAASCRRIGLLGAGSPLAQRYARRSRCSAG